MDTEDLKDIRTLDNCVMRTSHKLQLLFGLCMLDILRVRIVYIDPFYFPHCYRTLVLCIVLKPETRFSMRLPKVAMW